MHIGASLSKVIPRLLSKICAFLSKTTSPRANIEDEISEKEKVKESLVWHC